MLDHPIGELLPVYVWDKYEEYPNAIPMIDMDDAAIESYVAWNTEIVQRVVQAHAIHAIHANHAI